MSDPWYPHVDEYYVPDEHASEYPVRQGDLIRVSDEMAAQQPRWIACQVVHPTCEFAKRAVKEFQVIGVHRLGEVEAEHQEAVVAGETLVQDNLRVAFAHTFFLPPTVDLTEPMFSDFRRIEMLPRDLFTSERRVAALSHDARTHFIRRKLYWEQRWGLRLRETFRLEALRIQADPEFAGPKPTWATA